LLAHPNSEGLNYAGARHSSHLVMTNGPIFSPR
jgi:hypothetical protein